MRQLAKILMILIIFLDMDAMKGEMKMVVHVSICIQINVTNTYLSYCKNMYL